LPEPALKNFDRVADVYDETRGWPPDVAAEIGAALAKLLREIAPQPRLLEVGIGTGRIAVPLAGEGMRVAGVDISPKMLEILRAKGGDIDVMIAESSRLPFRQATFDAALFVHILHLVPDPAATMRATVPLVRPRGALIRGGDDRAASGLRERADGIIDQEVSALIGRSTSNEDNQRTGVDAFDDAVRASGARAEEITLARWTGKHSPRRMIERLRRKDYSGSWRIPDEAIPEIVARVTPKLEAFYGDLDAQYDVERSFSITIARLP
jgi:SAM-dependent methyltransferase